MPNTAVPTELDARRTWLKNELALVEEAINQKQHAGPSRFVRIRWNEPTASGRRAGWARTFTSIDRTLKGARAFEGHYLQNGILADLRIDMLIVEVFPTGSAKNGSDMARILRVHADGKLEPVGRDYEWRTDYLDFVDHCQSVLAGEAS